MSNDAAAKAPALKVVEPPADTTLLRVPPHVSLLILGRALAQFGLTMKATHDGAMRVEYAELTREEALKLNHRNARDPILLTPHDGYCWNCRADLVEQHGIAAIAAGINVTGCRTCHHAFSVPTRE